MLWPAHLHMHPLWFTVNQTCGNSSVVALQTYVAKTSVSLCLWPHLLLLLALFSPLVCVRRFSPQVLRHVTALYMASSRRLKYDADNICLISIILWADSLGGYDSKMLIMCGLVVYARVQHRVGL